MGARGIEGPSIKALLSAGFRRQGLDLCSLVVVVNKIISNTSEKERTTIEEISD